MMAWAMQCLGILVLAYAALCVFGWLCGLRLIFPRPAASYSAGPDYFFLTAADGAKIAARHWPNPEASHTVLWFHGNGEDLGDIADEMELWREKGFALLALDYRGYGLSEGRPTEANTYSDAALALEWLHTRRGTPLARIILAGYSVGSGPAVELATRETVAGLILLAPFVSAYRTRTIWPLVPGDKFANLAKIGRLRCPLLIVHGTADGVVPCWHGRALAAAARVRKQTLWVPEARHGNFDEIAGPRYFETIRAFADSL